MVSHCITSNEIEVTISVSDNVFDDSSAATSFESASCVTGSTKVCNFSFDIF